MSGQENFEKLCKRIRSILEAAGLKVENLLASLPQARERIYADHYERPNAVLVRSRRKRAAGKRTHKARETRKRT